MRAGGVGGGPVADLPVADPVGRGGDDRRDVGGGLAAAPQVQGVDEDGRVARFGADLVEGGDGVGEGGDAGEPHELQPDPGGAAVGGLDQGRELGTGVGGIGMAAHGEQEPGAEDDGEVEQAQRLVDAAVGAEAHDLQVEQGEAVVVGAAAQGDRGRGAGVGVEAQPGGVVARGRGGVEGRLGAGVEDGPGGEGEQRGAHV